MALLYPGGTTSLGSYKITARHPFDVRDIAVKFEDLLDLETFSNNVYEGLRVLVREEACVYELVPATQENRGGKIALQFDRNNFANNKKLWKRLTIETITTKEALQRAKNNLVNGALIYVANDIYEGDVYEIESVFNSNVPIGEEELDDISNAKIGYFSEPKKFYYYIYDGVYYIVTQKGLAKVFVAPDTDPIFIASDGGSYKYKPDYEGLEPYVVDVMPSMVKKGLYFCQNVNGEGVLTMAGGGGDAVDRLNEILDASIAKLSIDSTNRQLKATSSDNKNFFVAMTELIKPASPSIATTEHDVVTGNAEVDITNNQTDATLKYSTDGTSWFNVSGEKVYLASGFETTKDNSTKTYTLRVKAVLNGVESDVVTETITINPKVLAPTLTITRTPNNNDWATKAIITMTASSYKGAKSEYSTDGGTSWKEFTGTETFETTANSTAANQYQVKATRTDYVNSDIVKSAAITLNKKKFYYGRGPATLSSESDIKSLTGGGSIEKSTMAGSYSISSTETGKYTWFCGTGTLSSVTSGGFAVPMNSVVAVSGYNCYRSSSPVMELGTDTFVVS